MTRIPLIGVLLAAVLPAQQPAPLRVCATTSDLGALAQAVGGEQVAVTVFAAGAADPHFLEARPSLLRALSKADVLLEVGLELEVGWLPALVDNARNEAVLAGGAGRIDASTVVARLGVPAAPVDRSQGDVHAGGNPHFLADPLCGLQVAALLRDRFTALRPAAKAAFADGYQRLRDRTCEALVGEAVARLYDHDVEKLGELLARGRLPAVLESQGDLGKLGGWAAALLPYRGSKVVADHDLWPYFLRRFGLEAAGFCEPKPGVAPTTAHLQQLVAGMQRDKVQAVLSAPYFSPQAVEFVARATGARVVAMAHQTGALPDCTDYLATVGHNVQALAAALRGPQ